MNIESGPVYARVRAIVSARLDAHGYQLARESYVPDEPDFPTWDHGMAEYAGPGPLVRLTWDGAYRWLHLQVGDGAGWGGPLSPGPATPGGRDDGELLARAERAITEHCDAAELQLRAGG